MDTNNTIPTAPETPNEAPIVTPGAAAVPEAPVVGMPAMETPAVEAPAVEVPVAETPVVEAAAVSEMTIPGMPDMSALTEEAATVAAAAPEAQAAPEAFAASASPVEVGTPMTNPATMATPDTYSFGATDPLTVPEGPKAPDPIEEELKMPLKAADPVPGSIGSAVSMPADGTTPQVPNVAFNDPMTLQSNPMVNNSMRPAKPKADKKAIIIIGAVGAVVILGLVIVLLSQLF